MFKILNALFEDLVLWGASQQSHFLSVILLIFILVTTLILTFIGSLLLIKVIKVLVTLLRTAIPRIKNRLTRKSMSLFHGSDFGSDLVGKIPKGMYIPTGKDFSRAEIDSAIDDLTSIKSIKGLTASETNWLLKYTAAHESTYSNLWSDNPKRSASGVFQVIKKTRQSMSTTYGPFDYNSLDGQVATAFHYYNDIAMNFSRKGWRFSKHIFGWTDPVVLKLLSLRTSYGDGRLKGTVIARDAILALTAMYRALRVTVEPNFSWPIDYAKWIEQIRALEASNTTQDIGTMVGYSELNVDNYPTDAVIGSDTDDIVGDAQPELIIGAPRATLPKLHKLKHDLFERSIIPKIVDDCHPARLSMDKRLADCCSNAILSSPDFMKSKFFNDFQRKTKVVDDIYCFQPNVGLELLNVAPNVTMTMLLLRTLFPNDEYIISSVFNNIHGASRELDEPNGTHVSGKAIDVVIYYPPISKLQNPDTAGDAFPYFNQCMLANERIIRLLSDALALLGTRILIEPDHYHIDCKTSTTGSGVFDWDENKPGIIAPLQLVLSERPLERRLRRMTVDRGLIYYHDIV